MTRKKVIGPDELAELNKNHIGQPDPFAEQIESASVKVQTISVRVLRPAQILRSLIGLVRGKRSQNFKLEITYVNDDWHVALHDEESELGPMAGRGSTFFDAWTSQTKCAPDDSDYFRDIKLAHGFLAGHSPEKFRAKKARSKKFWPDKSYLKGDEETRARDALLRLLRNGKPLDVSLARNLADLLDLAPEIGTTSSFDITEMERSLVFKPRKGGRAQNLRKIEMALAFEGRLLQIRVANGAHQKSRGKEIQGPKP